MVMDLVTQFYANAGLYDLLFGPPPVQVTEMGPLRIEHTVELDVNQIPKSVTFLVTASPNRALVSARQVAEVRLEGDGSGSAFIVDFQTLRTVSAIGVPFPGGDDPQVIPWIGTRYDDDNPL